MCFSATTHAYVIIAPVAYFLVQALNLISNALKFSSAPGQTGEVCVRLKRIIPPSSLSPTIEIGAPNPCAGIFRIEVEDNGPGVPDDVAVRLFNPFTQVRV